MEKLEKYQLTYQGRQHISAQYDETISLTCAHVFTSSISCIPNMSSKKLVCTKSIVADAHDSSKSFNRSNPNRGYNTHIYI